MVSCDSEPLLRKQAGKDLVGVLPALQLVMRIENHGLDQGLGLLPTRFPDGFDGGTHFAQWWGETGQVRERIGDEHQTPMFLNGFGAPHPILVQPEVALPILIKGFNGMVTSDKFCMSRGVTLQLSWRRGPAPRTTAP